MPARKSAKKRMRTNEKRRLINKMRRSMIKTSEKKFKDFIDQGELENAKLQLDTVFKNLDKAVKQGTIHKNKANRKKSSLSLFLNAKK